MCVCVDRVVVIYDSCVCFSAIGKCIAKFLGKYNINIEVFSCSVTKHRLSLYIITMETYTIGFIYGMMMLAGVCSKFRACDDM